MLTHLFIHWAGNALLEELRDAQVRIRHSQLEGRHLPSGSLKAVILEDEDLHSV